MGKYINGDYMATCKVGGKCKIAAVYVPNKATNKVAEIYTCYNEDCVYHECVANGGTDDSYFILDGLI